MRASLLLIVVLASCVPPIPSVEGKACDDAHPCGPGFACKPSTCSAPSDAGVLLNGDFEEGIALSGWGTSGGAEISAQQTVVRSGSWAARAALKAGNTTSTFGMSSKAPSTRTTDAGVTWCAEAWVNRANVPVANRLRFFIRAYDEQDNFEDFEAPVNWPDAGWLKVTQQSTLKAPHDFTVGVRFSAESLPGGEFFADDVKLWQAGIGSICVAN